MATYYFDIDSDLQKMITVDRLGRDHHVRVQYADQVVRQVATSVIRTSELKIDEDSDGLVLTWPGRLLGLFPIKYSRRF